MPKLLQTGTRSVEQQKRFQNSSDWLQKMAQISLEATHLNSSLRLWKQMLFVCQGRANRNHARLRGEQLHATAWILEKWSGQEAKLDLRSCLCAYWCLARTEQLKYEPESLVSCGCMDPKKADQVRSGVHELKKEAARTVASGRMGMWSRGLRAKCCINHYRQMEQGLYTKEKTSRVRDPYELIMQSRELRAKCHLNRCITLEQAGWVGWR